MKKILLLTLTKNHIERFSDINFEIDSAHRNKLAVGNKIIFREDVEIGKNVGIYAGNKIASLGSYSFSRSAFEELIDFRTGNYVSIAENVQSFGFEHPTNFIGTSPIFYQKNRKLFPSNDKENLVQHSPKESISVGHDVWIGRNVLIKRGISIGDGAIIGAGSVVTKSVAPFSVIGGNPAKLIRQRFPEEFQKRLAHLQWWLYPAEVIQTVIFNQPFEAALLELEKVIEDNPKRILPKVPLLKFLNLAD